MSDSLSKNNNKGLFTKEVTYNRNLFFLLSFLVFFGGCNKCFSASLLGKNQRSVLIFWPKVTKHLFANIWRKRGQKHFFHFFPLQKHSIPPFLKACIKKRTLFHHRNNKNQCKVWVIDYRTCYLERCQVSNMTPRLSKIYRVLLSIIELYQVYQVFTFTICFKKCFKTYTQFYQCLPSSKRYRYNVLP